MRSDCDSWLEVCSSVHASLRRRDDYTVPLEQLTTSYMIDDWPRCFCSPFTPAVSTCAFPSIIYEGSCKVFTTPLLLLSRFTAVLNDDQFAVENSKTLSNERGKLWAVVLMFCRAFVACVRPFRSVSSSLCNLAFERRLSQRTLKLALLVRSMKRPCDSRGDLISLPPRLTL